MTKHAQIMDEIVIVMIMNVMMDFQFPLSSKYRILPPMKSNNRKNSGSITRIKLYFGGSKFLGNV